MDVRGGLLQTYLLSLALAGVGPASGVTPSTVESIGGESWKFIATPGDLLMKNSK